VDRNQDVDARHKAGHDDMTSSKRHQATSPAIGFVAALSGNTALASTFSLLPR
jgi:hypothetical protein